MPVNLAEVWGGALAAAAAAAAPPPDPDPVPDPPPAPDARAVSARLAALVAAPPPDPALLLERAVSCLGLVAALLVLLLVQLERTTAQLRRVEVALLHRR